MKDFNSDMRELLKSIGRPGEIRGRVVVDGPDDQIRELEKLGKKESRKRKRKSKHK